MVIKEGMVKHNYCVACACEILRKAKDDLEGLTAELDSGE